jgi:hypothetical protein
MNIACKREFKRMRQTMSEVIMKNLDLTMDTFMHRRWKLPILAFLLLVFGIFFTPADSVAQAVPPRSQTLQMIRPLVRPPEPPLEKKVRENQQDLRAAERQVQKNKIEVQYLKQKTGIPPHTGSFTRYPRGSAAPGNRPIVQQLPHPAPQSGAPVLIRPKLPPVQCVK